MDFKSLMQEMVNKDYNELVAFGKEAMSRVLPVCKAVDEEHEGMAVLTAILLSAVAADGKLTGLEAKYLSDLTGLDAAGIAKAAEEFL